MACLHVAPYLTISPVSPSADGTFIPVGVGIGVFLLLVMSIVRSGLNCGGSGGEEKDEYKKNSTLQQY